MWEIYNFFVNYFFITNLNKNLYNICMNFLLKNLRVKYILLHNYY